MDEITCEWRGQCSNIKRGLGFKIQNRRKQIDKQHNDIGRITERGRQEEVIVLAKKMEGMGWQKGLKCYI